MVNELRTNTYANVWNMLLAVKHRLLLVPEGVAIAVVLGLHVLLGNPPFAVPLAALLVISFMARTSALYLARSAIESARYREADAFVRFALALHPWSADGLALRGMLALATGAPDVAEGALRRSLQLFPQQPATQAALSCALLDLGRPTEAATVAQQVLQLDERYALAYLYVAEAERATGAPAYRVEDWLRAGLKVVRAPAAQAAIQFALARHLMLEQRMAEATLIIHSAETLLPSCPVSRQAELHFYLGELLSAQGQFERAREHFQGVEALDPQGRYAAAAWRAAQPMYD